MPETSGRCGVCTSDTSAGRRALAPCREQDPEVVAVDGAAGDPRMFVYNGPFIDPEWRWSEVQVPVRRRATPSKDAPAAASAPGAKPAAPAKPVS